MQDERDVDLLALFKQQGQNLPDEPFVSDLMGRLKKSQSRKVLRQRLFLVLGFVGCVLLSPYLIKGSILLSSGLTTIFNTGGRLISTPMGALSAILGALLILFFSRGRIFRFV